jgi:hypothetical protein
VGFTCVTNSDISRITIFFIDIEGLSQKDISPPREWVKLLLTLSEDSTWRLFYVGLSVIKAAHGVAQDRLDHLDRSPSVLRFAFSLMRVR